MDNYIESLIDDIINYIEFLKNEKNYFITVHPLTKFLHIFESRFYEYNIHYNPYCLAIKSKPENWNKCVSCQNKILGRLGSGAFFGMCHAGVGEYVFPLGHNGFISVSGYRVNEDEAYSRIKKIATESFLDEKLLIDAYKQNSNPNPPDFEEVKTLIQPLCHMFYCLSEKIEQTYYKINTDRIYSPDDIYKCIIHYIYRNFNSRITLEDLGNLCKCSTSHISHLFRKRSGYSINQYINNIRMEKSKLLLENTRFSVQEICGMVGFSDANYFTTTFKKCFGQSPTEYRKQNCSLC